MHEWIGAVDGFVEYDGSFGSLVHDGDPLSPTLGLPDLDEVYAPGFLGRR